MYFIIRALKYLKRKIGKTVFMGVIFFVIANFVLAGLLIKEASALAEESTRLAIGSDVTYTLNTTTLIEDIDKGVLDREIMQSFRNNSVLSEEDFTSKGAPTVSNVQLAATSEYVSSYQIESTIDVTNSDYYQVQVEADGSETGDFKVNFYDSNVPEDFVDATSSLVDGNLISEAELESGALVVMIEEEFADLNNLEVGDTLTLSYPEVDAVTYKLDHEIVGIYESTEEADQSIIQSGDVSGYAPNQFYAPFNTYLSIGYDQETIDNMVVTDNVIRLTDPDDIDAFKAEVETLVNLSYGALDANDDLYESLVGPIQIVGLISNIAVIVILISGGLIIGLITALTVNERRSEVGILLAVGERKTKIVMQFVLEVLIIAIVTFSLSIISGNIMGQEITNSDFASEFISSEETTTTQQNQPGQRNRPGETSTQIEVDQPELEIKLSLEIIALLFSMGMSLAIIATIIPSLYVMRFNPKQILSSRVS